MRAPLESCNTSVGCFGCPMKYNARTLARTPDARKFLCGMWRTNRAQRLACAVPRESLRKLYAKIRNVYFCSPNSDDCARRGVGFCARKIHATGATAVNHSARRELAAVGCAREPERQYAANEAEWIKPNRQRLSSNCRRRRIHLRRPHSERHAVPPSCARRRRTMLSAQGHAQLSSSIQTGYPALNSSCVPVGHGFHKMRSKDLQSRSKALPVLTREEEGLDHFCL